MTTSFSPRLVSLDECEIALRPMRASDEPALLAFAKALPTHDLLFLPRDLGEPKVIAAWVAESVGGRLHTLLAFDGDRVVGCVTIVSDPLSWSRHVGELRVLIAPSMRGKGLGRKLMEICFGLAVELGLEKLVAQMTVDQLGAIAVFRSLGFRPEALFSGHAKDRDGRKHDLVVLGHDVARFQAQMEAYGVTGIDAA